MKTKSFIGDYITDIQIKLQDLIDNGEVKEVISFSISSYWIGGNFGSPRHSAILIYK